MKKRYQLLTTFLFFSLTCYPIMATSLLSRITTSFLALSSTFLGGQAQTTSFEKSFGGTNTDIGNSIFAFDTDLVAVAGATDSYGSGGNDFLFNTYNSDSGNLILSKAIGTSGDEVAYSISDTDDGGFVLLGEIEGQGAGGKDILLTKLDSNGALVWAKAIGDIGDEVGRSVKRTSDNGFIIVACTDSFGTYNDPLLMKTDSLGAIEWTFSMTGTYNDESHDVEIMSDGSYLMVGFTETHAQENSDILIVKVSTTGSLDWAKTIHIFDSSANGIAIENDDSFGAVGYLFDPEVGFVEIFLSFLSDGSLLCAEAFGTGNKDCSTSIIKTDVGYGVVGMTPRTGGHNLQLSLTEMSDDCQMDWYKLFGDGEREEIGNSITKDDNGDLLVVGGIDTNLLFGKFNGEGLEDCSPLSSPPILNVFPDSEEYTITPTVTAPSLTETDITILLTVTDISSPTESTLCSQ